MDRSVAWRGQARLLVRDYAALSASTAAFSTLRMIHIFLRRLAKP